MWTKEKLQERAKALFNSEYVSEEINKANQVKWVKSVETLGSKWLYHESNKITRKDSK
jgi:hypothetical protein